MDISSDLSLETGIVNFNKNNPALQHAKITNKGSPENVQLGGNARSGGAKVKEEDPNNAVLQFNATESSPQDELKLVSSHSPGRLVMNPENSSLVGKSIETC